VFSCQDVEAFVAQSRAHAARLPVSMKTLLKIPTGTKLIARDDVSPDNPPKISDPGLVTSHDMIFPLAALDALPIERKIRVSEIYNGVAQSRQWWKLDRMPGPDGNEISGWLCEIDPITTRHSPWEWEGFDFIKETSSLSDQYASHLSAQAQLDDDERARYRLQIDAGDSGPIRERLYDLIDLDRDQKLTPREIRTALEKPWIAQSLGRLITHYESEWYDDGTMSKWNALDGYMNEAGMADWEQEKQRIRSLLWWGELEGKQEFPSTGTAWHLQSTDLITLFSKKSFKFTLEIMRKLYPILSSEQNKDLQEIADELNSHIDFYKLDTHLRRAHFFAQILQETGPKLRIEEVFAYRQSTLIKKFEYFRLHPELALEHGLQNGFGKLKSNGFPMNQNDFEAIANAAYGERSELGNRGYLSGDGWKYRGRGLKQLTGRYNYLDLNDWHKKNKRLWPDDNSDFVENPDLLLKMKYATRSAAYFWLKKELYKRADTGSTPEAVDLITDIINRYTESRYLRKLNFSILWGNEVLK
jgi:predicted chitinase